jgi:hypothetical protein
MNSIHQLSDEMIKNHVAESDSMAASNGDKSASENRAEILRAASMRVARAIDAQHAFADLLRLAGREVDESINAASIADMIDCMADRFDESFSPFRGVVLSGLGDGC